MSDRAETPLVLIRGELPPAAICDLQAEFATVALGADELPTTLPSLWQKVRALAALGTTGADDRIMAGLPALELISVFGVGVDGVDVEAARRRGIRVTNTPGVLTDDTADYGFALLLALSRRLVAGDRFVRAGRWGASRFADGIRLRGRTLGIVGMGRIGQAIANRAVAFGMKVEWHGPRPKAGLGYRYHASLIGLAQSADALILCCPGGPATAGLVDAQVLDALGPEKYLVNISRGTVVDQDALVACLVAGRLGGAALDVLRNEPEVPAALLSLENVIIEPHMASATMETRREIGRLMVRNLRDHFGGKPLDERLVC